MKWIVDTTGRFGWRPYYTQAELNSECERIVFGFLRQKYGKIRFPLSTDDLTVLVERDVSDLDLYADLSADGDDVEGATDFFRDKKPEVKINRELSLDSTQVPRLRTTLAHEYGHVKFHNFLWNLTNVRPAAHDLVPTIARQRKALEKLRRKISPPDQSLPPDGSGRYSLPGAFRQGHAATCNRANILRAPESDWMEWQAGYACGAILMPASTVKHIAFENISGNDEKLPCPTGSQKALEIIDAVSAQCDVSTPAARTRLVSLGILY